MKGAYQSPFIIRTLALHLSMTGNFASDDGYPFAALALATAAVSRRPICPLARLVLTRM